MVLLLLAGVVVAGGKGKVDPAKKKVKDFPKGTFEKSGHHYYVLPERASRKRADKLCEDLGGHLLSIDSRREAKFFDEYVKKYPTKGDWLLSSIDAGNRKQVSYFKRMMKGEPYVKKGLNEIYYSNTNNFPSYSYEKKADFNRNGFILCEWDY